ncbi:hypothetical protein QUF74_03990 [Candidatus Halobeggiatoa sp. HSG11]|nr:hypothetical protein [Candidatus Halobeggiatoa sp. HSG11]
MKRFKSISDLIKDEPEKLNIKGIKEIKGKELNNNLTLFEKPNNKTRDTKFLVKKETTAII